jgi:hypothetical protein
MTNPNNKRITKKRELEIKQAFNKVDVIRIKTEFGDVDFISLDELPMSQMAKFMSAPGEERMMQMFEFLQLCVVNPEDWEKIADLPVRKLNRIIQQWMSESNGPGPDPDDGGEDDE